MDPTGTINSTAKNAGLLNIVEIPERRNAVKVLMLYDVGGSMDQHIELCSQLFSAARTEFKYLDAFISTTFSMKAFGTITSDVFRIESLLGS